MVEGSFEGFEALEEWKDQGQDDSALNTHRIIFEDILKATGKLGRQPHKGHLPS